MTKKQWKSAEIAIEQVQETSIDWREKEGERCLEYILSFLFISLNESLVVVAVQQNWMFC